jgi:hypothetical protein
VKLNLERNENKVVRADEQVENPALIRTGWHPEASGRPTRKPPALVHIPMSRGNKPIMRRTWKHRFNRQTVRGLPDAESLRSAPAFGVIPVQAGKSKQTCLNTKTQRHKVDENR